MSGPDADVLERLASRLRAEGGLIAEVVVRPEASADRTVSSAINARPRAGVVGPDLALAAEATREAELLHHAPEHARVVRTDDRDLALLIGDRLYALGLGLLADGGWTTDIAILADVVALVASLHADVAWGLDPEDPAAISGGTGDPGAAAGRTAGLWNCAAIALGDGVDSPAAKVLTDVRRGVVPSVEKLQTVLSSR